MRSKLLSRGKFVAILLAGLAAIFLTSRASTQNPVQKPSDDVDKVLSNYNRIDLDLTETLKQVRLSGRISLSTSFGTLNLELEPFDIRADNYRAVAVGADGKTKELPRTPSRSFRGKVTGMSNSYVRLVLDGEVLEGIIITPDETFFIEPERNFSSTAGDRNFIFYSASNVKEQNLGECGTTLAQRVGAQSSFEKPNAAAATTENAFSPKAEAEIATEADFEFYQANGSNETATNQDILDVLTQVDGIYDAQLGIKIKLVFQRTWTIVNDPYTATSDEAALDELAEDYNPSFPSGPPARDITHLFTGRDLVNLMTGDTIGIAFLSTVCNDPTYAYGISESKFSANSVFRVALTAHEIGHNFGAEHPDEENPVPPSCNPSIMNSSIQNTSNFCQFSRDQMTDHVALFGNICLSRLPEQPNCAYSINPFAQSFPAGGGNGNVNLTAGAGCNWTASEGATWLNVTSGTSGTGSGAVSYTVAANTGGPRYDAIDVGGQKLTITQATSASCGSTPISNGQALNGALTISDCYGGQPIKPNRFIDLYTFAGSAGQRVRIEMNAVATLDTYLYLFGPSGTIVAENDDIVLGTNTNSRIPLDGFFTLPETGTYTIEASSFDENVTGSYTVTFTVGSPAPGVQLSAGSYTVNEGDLSGPITVTRTGDLSSPTTVKYVTSDTTDVNFNCNPSTAGQPTGAASRKCDYHILSGRLRFAAGESSKQIILSVVNDVYVEPSESLTITLSNPTGATLGSQNTATINITDNDTAGQANPIDGTSFYVRMLYVDLLSREPDPAGFAGWVHRIDFCGQPGEPPPPCDRVTVGGDGFLRSGEFFDREFFVLRLYRAGLGRILVYSEVGDLAYVSGFLTASDLELNKQDLVAEIMSRPEFGNTYNSLGNAAYVDKLIQTAAVTIPQSVRDDWVAALNGSTKTRAIVYRELSERQEVSDRYLHEAQVVSCYYGFFTRNPDGAYLTYLDRLDRGEINLGDLANAFINASEYRLRFGP